MKEGTVAHMIVIPSRINRKYISVANNIISRNGENQFIETWLPAYQDKNLKDMPLSIGGYFYGYIPKSWLVPFKSSEENSNG